MHVFDQSSTPCLNPRTELGLDSATSTSLKAEGTRPLKPLRLETRAKDVASHYLALTQSIDCKPRILAK